MRCSSTPRSVIKRFLIIVVVLGLVVGVGLVAVRRYVGSRGVANQVAEQVKSAYGGDVKVGEVDVGIATTSVRNFEFFEKDCPH